MISRRDMLTGPLLTGPLLTGPLLTGPALSGARAAAEDRNQDLQRGIAGLERRHGGRLGVAVLDSAGRRLEAYRGDERFALCSTHKLLAAAFVLARVDRKQESLARRVAYAREDLVAYAPTTERHVGPDGMTGGMTLGELCEAAVTLSDNTAANLLLDSFGGPAGLTAYLRSLGDGVTRLDRREPALSEARPGDARDTTTPAAMVGVVHAVVLGGELSAASQAQLAAWLIACRTGDKRLRAGVPQGWRVGDKTGSGANDTTNDVAVLWPPGRAPVIVAAYYAEARASEEERDAVLAEVGRLAAAI